MLASPGSSHVARAAAVFLLISSVCGAAHAARKQPNILFILADDLGYGDLGVYGQKRITTPNLDRLAAQGTRFTQAHAGATVCAPSRSVLMTGLHTGHARIRGNGGTALEPGDVTVAEVLKAAGYSTGLVGKWGLGREGTAGAPNKQGFDEFLGYLDQSHAHNSWPTFLWRNGDKVKLRNVVPDELNSSAGVASVRMDFSGELFTQEALSFLDRHKSQPFFLYLALTTPHANNEGGNMGIEVPDLGAYKDRDWPEVEKRFAALVSWTDAAVGRVLDRLKALGLDDDTIVFFTSDNGAHHEGGHDAAFFTSSGPLRGTKRDLTDGGRESHEKVFTQAVRWRDWKAIRKGLDGKLALYDVVKDLGEAKDVAAEHPDVVAAIQAYLKTARVDSKEWPIR